VNNPYETCIIYDGTLGDDVIAKEQQAVEKFLIENADLEKVEQWGKRRLAYDIKKRKAGVYVLFRYLAESEIPSKLDRQFKLNQTILRYLTIRRDPRFDTAPAVAASDTGGQNDADDKGNEREAGSEETGGEE
jgi:small subunit ribosomal protein S6